MNKKEILGKKCLELISYLRKNKLKEKTTILDMGNRKMRVDIFRTDNLLTMLEEEKHIQQITKIFKDTIEFSSTKDLPELLNSLVKNGLLMKLDRAPSKLPTPKYKWPRNMMLNRVM